MNDAQRSRGTEAELGTRLLVSGEPRWGGDALDEPIAWPCGFTRPWTEEEAAEWAPCGKGLHLVPKDEDLDLAVVPVACLSQAEDDAKRHIKE